MLNYINPCPYGARGVLVMVDLLRYLGSRHVGSLELDLVGALS